MKEIQKILFRYVEKSILKDLSDISDVIYSGIYIIQIYWVFLIILRIFLVRN